MAPDRFHSVFVPLSLCFLLMTGNNVQGVWAAIDTTVSREEIQHFFTSDQGNSVRTGAWMNRYLRKDVTWMSQVFAIHKRPESMRVELLVKVLPDSILYDTVLVIEGNTQLDSRIQKGSWITFTGRIFNGVDALGVKEVQVLLKDPSALRLFEKSPEEQYILPTSN